jgi:hypothetical protein
MKLSRNIINKCWFVGICSAVLVVVAVYSLMDFNSADERDDATVAKTQNERLAPPVINRKTPNALRRKMLQAPTLARHIASQIESEERMNLRVSAEEIYPGTSLAEKYGARPHGTRDFIGLRGVWLRNFDSKFCYCS